MTGLATNQVNGYPSTHARNEKHRKLIADLLNKTRNQAKHANNPLENELDVGEFDAALLLMRAVPLEGELGVAESANTLTNSRGDQTKPPGTTLRKIMLAALFECAGSAFAHSSSYGYQPSTSNNYRGSTGQHYVNSYSRSDGTEVQGHYQANPNSTKMDNWNSAPWAFVL